MNEKDYASYLLALVSVILAIIGITSEEFRIIALIIGSLGICVAIITIKINEYIKKINTNAKDIHELKRELHYFKNLQQLKEEIIVLRDEINKK